MPAVIVRSLWDTGFSLVSISAVVSGVSCSSLARGLSPLRVLDLYRDDLILKSSDGQCRTEPLLRPQGPLVLILSGYLNLLGQIPGMQSAVFVCKGIV